MYNIPFERLIVEIMKNGKQNMQGTETSYYFLGYEFAVSRKELLDYYGNPIYIINPVGYVNELPKIKGYRRNNVQQWYTTQSYNIEDTMKDFFTKLYEIIGTPNDTLYHNVKAVK